MLRKGDEISLSVDMVPDLKDAKKGSEVELEIKAKVIGTHTHSMGKKTEKMVDVQVISVEAEYEVETEEVEEVEEGKE